MKFYASIWIKMIAFGLGSVAMSMAPHAARAQSDFTSPYSIYGPGTVIHRQSVLQAGFGGAGVALIDPHNLNMVNPAVSAYALDPVFEVAGMGSFSTFRTDAESFDNKRFMFNNIGLNLPVIRNKWALNIGLTALTDVGYDVNVTRDGGENIGHYNTEYSGNGGLNQFYVGSSYKLLNRADSIGNVTALAVGANYNFDFGVIESTRRIHYVDDLNSMGLTAYEKDLLKRNNAEIGVHFQTPLIKRTETNPRFLKIMGGFSTSLGLNMKAERDLHVYTIKYVNQDAISPADTLRSLAAVKGDIQMPVRYSVGFALDYFSVQRRRLRFAVDYTTEQWSNYSDSFGESTGPVFEDARTIAGGVEYTPEVGSREFFKALRYRLGFNHQETNLELEGHRIKDVGMSFGLTLPINLKRALTQSSLNIAGRYGRYGTTADGLIEEEYFHVYVGFSFTPHFRNRWFVQPKYD